MSFWKELSRRNVIKVGIAYAVAAWLIIHPVDIIFPILHLPEWSITLVTAFLIICSPFVLLFSWVYEITPKGLKKTKEVPSSKSITHVTGRRLNNIIIGLLVVALGYFVFDKYFIEHSAVETQRAPAITETVNKQKTIAVLPFTDLSPAKDQEYFVDGLSEELLDTLTKIPDLLVTARTSSFSFKNSNKTVQEIASILGVDNILEGSLRKAGNELRISAQLIRSKDGFHLWSEKYDRELKDIFAVQEDIATAVAKELKITLGIGKSLKQLGGTDNVEAYALFLLSGEQALDGESSLALKNIDAAIALDPEFALAWVSKSSTHLSISRGRFTDLYAPQLEEAERAVMKAIEIEPNCADAYYQLGDIRLTQGEFLEAASAFRKAAELSNSPTGAIFDNAHLLQDVGYLKMTHKIMVKERLTNPIDQTGRAEYIHSLAFIGDMKGAEEEYESGKAMFGDGWFLGNILITHARLGAGQAVSRDDILIPGPVHDAAKEYLDSPKDGLAELHRFYNDNDYQDLENLTSIAYWAAYFGDPELSMNAIEKVINIDAENIKHFWQPLFKEVRQLPRFKKLIKKIGLVEVWEKFGWPDMCHKLDNGDFVCE
jgi:TolB-like protein